MGGRDRQRGKQRRRSRGEGNTPTPNPLSHSSADVDEARLAEEGIVPPEVGEELTGGFVAAAPDQIEGDLVPSTYEDEIEEEKFAAGEKPGIFRRAVIFLGHVVDELKRVQWPTRQQTIQGTAVTLGFVIIAGGYLGLLDALWSPLVNWII
jgi:preprotein translocase subunit SecE